MAHGPNVEQLQRAADAASTKRRSMMASTVGNVLEWYEWRPMQSHTIHRKGHGAAIGRPEECEMRLPRLSCLFPNQPSRSKVPADQQSVCNANRPCLETSRMSTTPISTVKVKIHDHAPSNCLSRLGRPHTDGVGRRPGRGGGSPKTAGDEETGRHLCDTTRPRPL